MRIYCNQAANNYDLKPFYEILGKELWLKCYVPISSYYKEHPVYIRVLQINDTEDIPVIYYNALSDGGMIFSDDSSIRWDGMVAHGYVHKAQVNEIKLIYPIQANIFSTEALQEYNYTSVSPNSEDINFIRRCAGKDIWFLASCDRLDGDSAYIRILNVINNFMEFRYIPVGYVYGELEYYNPTLDDMPAEDIIDFMYEDQLGHTGEIWNCRDSSYYTTEELEDLIKAKFDTWGMGD